MEIYVLTVRFRMFPTLCRYPICSSGEVRQLVSIHHQWFAERYEGFVYLDRIAIDSSHQNRGIRALLYQAVEQNMLKSAECSLLRCEANLEPPNLGSLRFHQCIRFIEVGQSIGDYANHSVSYLSKSLSEH